MDSDKTEVFKIKLLNRLYGSAHDSGSGSSGAECPEGIASSTRVKPIPVGERTRRLYTAPLPEVWPPLRAPAECPDDPQVDEGLTRSSCSSSEVRCFQLQMTMTATFRKEKEDNDINEVETIHQCHKEVKTVQTLRETHPQT
ncbi:uncharacterized protein LOC121375769 isoform X2 [Gigantopelta aegis]|uniref:uncharacterized protein LOC121375769 isoform X2 n=1 Tax=Gigantopelta aegis TaxID=1735272 RepID=UPI001B88A5D6|nr:uncharacterized protein LOC121375769 isoform X2 [Gigantopelta aegis]